MARLVRVSGRSVAVANLGRDWGNVIDPHIVAYPDGRVYIVFSV